MPAGREADGHVGDGKHRLVDDQRGRAEGIGKGDLPRAVPRAAIFNGR